VKFGNDLVSIENTGDNHGAEVGINNGSVVVQRYGLGYTDTKNLCYDIIREELDKYHAEASEEAKKRSDELFKQFTRKLAELKMNDSQILFEFKKPSMQFDYLEAQKAYMKIGTPELLDMLSEILVNRISASTGTLLQIVLGEAIQVVAKLVPSQMATLALLFVTGYSRAALVKDYQSFIEHIKSSVLPIFKSGVSQKSSDFQHLNFTGCTQRAALGVELISLLKGAYPEIFVNGIEKSQIPKGSNSKKLFETYPLFEPCSNCTDRLRINAISEQDLHNKMSHYSVDPKDRDVLIKLFKESIMSDSQAQELAISLVPEMRDVFKYWTESEIKYYGLLSSVGIVIGAEYACKISNHEYNLNLWI